MPKKRFNNQYRKPPTTVHPSLNSTATGSSSSKNQQDGTPTVNALINRLRVESSGKRRPVEIVPNHTLPPNIRQILDQPETPTPRPRYRLRRRFDENGRVVPAGPPPPRSWLQDSIHWPPELRDKNAQRAYPSNLAALPGLTGEEFDGNRLQDMCLRAMARNWEFLQEYEKHNLAGLETRVRMLLLSYIAVYGPENGVGYEGLRHIVAYPGPEDEEVAETDIGVHNKDFFRLDLSGAMGYSVSFKQLTALVQGPESETKTAEESWEDSFQPLQSLSPPLPHLTHLSLSHPATSISWPKLLTFSKHLPTLTHLSLAYWPVPSTTPNSKLAKFVTSAGREVQYGGTNYYSHLLDDDYIEAAGILRRLASKLYSLEYLDLTGCQGWCRALQDGNQTSQEHAGIDWGTQWPRLRMLVLHTGTHLDEDSESLDVINFSSAFGPVFSTRVWMMQTMRRNRVLGKPAHLIDVQVDDLSAYETLWREENDQNKKKRTVMDKLKEFTQMEVREKLSTVPPEEIAQMEEIQEMLRQHRLSLGSASTWT